MKMRMTSQFTMGKGLFILSLMWILSLGTFAQNITVKGTVKDTDQQPLIGVTVRVQNSSMVVTDYDGITHYQILHLTQRWSFLCRNDYTKHSIKWKSQH